MPRTVKYNMHLYLSEFLDEVHRYKWLESEKCGYDIGEEKAVKIWIQQHHDAWFKSLFLSE